VQVARDPSQQDEPLARRSIWKVDQRAGALRNAPGSLAPAPPRPKGLAGAAGGTELPNLRA